MKVKYTLHVSVAYPSIARLEYNGIMLFFVVFFLSIRCALMYIVAKFPNVVKKPHVVKVQFCCISKNVNPTFYNTIPSV